MTPRLRRVLIMLASAVVAAVTAASTSNAITPPATRLR